MDSQDLKFLDDFDVFSDNCLIDLDYLMKILNEETKVNTNATQVDIKNILDPEIPEDMGVILDEQVVADCMNEFGKCLIEEPVLSNVEPQVSVVGRWVRRRRLDKDSEEYKERQRWIRLQNRLSARRSLENKEAHLRELEAKVMRLRAENEFRRRVLQIFPNLKPASRLSGLRRSFSTSDFYLPIEVNNEQTDVQSGSMNVSTVAFICRSS